LQPPHSIALNQLICVDKNLFKKQKESFNELIEFILKIFFFLTVMTNSFNFSMLLRSFHQLKAENLQQCVAEWCFESIADNRI
jgi:hypothetical protein